MKFLLLSHLLLCTKTQRNEQGVLVFPMPSSHCNPSSSHWDTQWESCLACSHLHFGHLGPENVKQLLSLSLSWLLCMPGHSYTNLDMPYLFRAHVPCTCTCDTHVMHMPDVTSLGL